MEPAAIEQTISNRSQQTRERLRVAAHRLFLKRGYLATSTDAILAEAGVSSKETLYRHYASKEDLFVDVLRHLSIEQPGFLEAVSALPVPGDLLSLRRALTMLARELLSLMSHPEYLALLRVMIAEAPRFPHLSPLFLSAIPQRGVAIITTLLQRAKDLHTIADVDMDAVTRALLGGLLTYALPGLLAVGEVAEYPSPDGRAEAIVEIVMRALAREPYPS